MHCPCPPHVPCVFACRPRVCNTYGTMLPCTALHVHDAVHSHLWAARRLCRLCICTCRGWRRVPCTQPGWWLAVGQAPSPPRRQAACAHHTSLPTCPGRCTWPCATAVWWQQLHAISICAVKTPAIPLWATHRCTGIDTVTIHDGVQQARPRHDVVNMHHFVKPAHVTVCTTGRSLWFPTTPCSPRITLLHVEGACGCAAHEAAFTPLPAARIIPRRPLRHPGRMRVRGVTCAWGAWGASDAWME